jgi:autotransporter-associated beta strand protein
MKTAYTISLNSTAARMAGGFSRKLVTSLGVALVALASVVPANADVWLNETFEQYTVAAPPTAPTVALSPFLQQISAASTVVGTVGNQMCRYNKPTAATLSPAGLQYSLSAANATPRPKGYISFKVVQNTPPSPAISSSDLSLRLGSNDSTTMGSANSAFIDVRFTPSVSPATTCAFSVRSGGATQSVITTVSATAQSTIKIWYNSDAVGMPYTDPVGAFQTLSAASYVCYVNNVLASASASGTTLVGFVTTSASAVIPPVTSTVIGKLAFQCGSNKAVDFSVDDIYAADSAPVVTTPPVITSATTATGYQGIAFSYQITADQGGLTSFALASGTLPAGLTLDTATGIISGTPSATGTSNVTLTATNVNGTSAAAPLAITVIVPLNTFSGSNVSLNTSASWSLGAAPNSTTSIGSYQDVALASSVTALTTSSGALFAKSWNVSNGSSYTLTSVKPDGATTFRMGITSPVVTTFTNTVSGITNDLVYLTGNSNITFSPLNSINALTPSTVELSNSGNLNIGAGSTLNIDAVTTGQYALTKTSAGTVGLSAANTYNGGTTLTAGSMNVSGSAAPTRLAQVKANVTGGVVTGYTVVDGGAGYTAVPTVTVSKNTGEGTVVEAKAVATISGGAVTAVTIGTVAGSGYTVAPKVQIYSNQSPLGSGAVTLAGGALNASVDTDLSRMTFFPDVTNTFFRINGTPLIINGSVSLDVAADKTLSAHSLTGNGGANLVTKTGAGTLWLRGGGATNVVGGWSVNAGTLFVGTTASSGTGTGLVTMNGGNLRFSKGLSSNGSYTGQGQDAGLVVNQDTTITLDANPATPSGSNTVSYGTNDSASGSVLTTGLTIGTKTINLVKSAAAKSSADELGYSDPLMTFYSANLSGTATLNVGALSQMSLQNAVGTGGVTKTGTGRLSISERNVYDGAVPPVFVATLPNTYTGATAINAGTAAFSGTQASSITIANGAFLESSVDATPSTTGSLTLAVGSTVTIVGTPTLASYTLFTAAGGITGTPVLAVAVAGYDLVKDGNSLKLNAVSSGSYSTWATDNGISGEPASGDFENDGISNLVEYALGTNPTVSTQPAGVLAGNVITFTKGADAIANGDVSWVIETSETLENGSWTAQVTQAAGNASPTISYTLTPGSPAKNFARLKATQN